MQHPFDAIIGLGSNLGDKQANIQLAIDHLTADGALKLVRRSKDYRSAPWGKTDQDWFVNACISVATQLSPREVLERCFAAERALQRVRLERWGPRTLDCDVLLYRDVISDDPELTLPHPRTTERAFVLVPLIEIAPDIVINGRRASEWLKHLDAGDVVAIVLLPGAENAFIEPEKISAYLLSDAHPDGQSKASFFKAFGFSPQNPEKLSDSLLGLARNGIVTAITSSPHGTKYVIEGPIQAPDSRAPMVKTVWIVDFGEAKPRLVTAYPGKFVR